MLIVPTNEGTYSFEVDVTTPDSGLWRLDAKMKEFIVNFADIFVSRDRSLLPTSGKYRFLLLSESRQLVQEITLKFQSGSLHQIVTFNLTGCLGCRIV
jgi:hypothetical protein